MSAHPEHDLQVKINQWVRINVPQPHFFTGVDRAKATGRFTHARQKSRGLVAGTPDTILVLPDLPLIAIELKAKGEKVLEDSNQERVGQAIQAAGHFWGWTDSVMGYGNLLLAAGVKLARYWEVAAAAHDAALAGAAIKRDEAKTGKPSPKRWSQAKPSASMIRRTEALRKRVMF